MTARFQLDGSYRRYDRVVIAGSPLRLFRLSAGGRRMAQAIESGLPPPDGHAALTSRLVDAGAIHPVPEPPAYTTADVTVVVPAHNATPTVHQDGDVIVVDDGSDPPLTASGARAIRLPVNRGPAAARNAGLAEVTTPLVAFVDTDVDAPDGWLQPLLAHFGDRRVALVAPRVASSADDDSTLARYERARSPLDLGQQRARIAPGSRVSYVPAAAVLVRTDAVRSIGGFDETMRTGEDVDMVWRLIGAGHRCRYEPASVVHHRPRPTATAWARQRVVYGRSAAALDRRHRHDVAPLRISGWSAAVWALVALGRRRAALALAAGTTVALRRKLHDVPPAECIRLAGLGHLYAGRQVANATTRAWWPVALVAALCSRRLRTFVAAAAIVPPLLDWVVQRPPLGAAKYVALRVADDAAYGAGLWLGVIDERSAGALAPNFTNWPGRTAG